MSALLSVSATRRRRIRGTPRLRRNVVLWCETMQDRLVLFGVPLAALPAVRMLHFCLFRVTARAGLAVTRLRGRGFSSLRLRRSTPPLRMRQSTPLRLPCSDGLCKHLHGTRLVTAEKIASSCFAYHRHSCPSTPTSPWSVGSVGSRRPTCPHAPIASMPSTVRGALIVSAPSSRIVHRSPPSELGTMRTITTIRTIRTITDLADLRLGGTPVRP